MTSFLQSARYRAFVRDTHPELSLSDDRLAVPSFRAVLDTREPLLPGFYRRVATVAKRLTPRNVTPRCLFIGTPFEPYNQTAVLDDIVDVPTFVSNARRSARRQGDSVIVLTNVERTHPVVDELCGHGFISFPSFPDTVLDLRSSFEVNSHLSSNVSSRVNAHVSFEGLLATRSRMRRRNVRRHIAKFHRAGHSISRVRDSSDHGAALFQSYRPFYERAQVRWHPHTEAYFSGIAALDDQVVLSVAHDASHAPIGFVVGFNDDHAGIRTFHAGRVGVHPDHDKKDAVYFRLVYRAIEDAISEGADRISLEPTAYRLKRHLGAEPVPLVNLLLPVSPLWRMVARSAAALGRHALRHLDDHAKLDEFY